MNISHIGPPLIAIYLLADVGSVAGGWFSSRLLKMGWTPNACAQAGDAPVRDLHSSVIYAPITRHLWVAVVLIGIAAAAHQGFSANIFTTASDMFPTWAVASIVGFGGMAAQSADS